MEKINVRPISHEVTDRVREMIRTGVLQKGGRINESELCRTMGVSRTPVREALRLLSSEGLVVLIPRKGAFVTQPLMEDVRDMFEVVSSLEALCARLAVQKGTDEAFRELEGLHEELETHFRMENREGYVQCNHRYHQYVQQMADNRILDETLNGLRQKLLLYRFQQLSQPRRFRESIQEHRLLLDAFRKRDAVRAEALMRHHLMMQCEALTRLYSSEEKMEPEA